MVIRAHQVSVVICAYADERRPQLVAAIESITRQTLQAKEIIVVIDHNPSLLEFVSAAFAEVVAVANDGPRGLSGARNTGVRHAKGTVIAFLDDDAIAAPDWLENMVAHYDTPAVMGVGGGVVPIWPEQAPKWLPEEFFWVVGCSYRGQPDRVAPVRNPIGCNMSFRRDVFNRIGGFTEGIGREGKDASGCEETEFCIRAHQAWPQAQIIYDPAVSVQHHVTPERTCWSYFRRRCLAEGRSKTRVVQNVGSGSGLSSERSYVAKVLPLGILRGIREAFLHFDLWGFARAAGIVAGTGYTAYGYFSEKLAGGRR
jgi:glucosyl-dolichyl phosphate glucuronosyltransferase